MMNVAIEIDGDPSRQDINWKLAAQALAAGCLFSLDSDAHSPEELVYSETAVAHARLGGHTSVTNHQLLARGESNGVGCRGVGALRRAEGKGQRAKEREKG